MRRPRNCTLQIHAEYFYTGSRTVCWFERDDREHACVHKGAHGYKKCLYYRPVKHRSPWEQTNDEMEKKRALAKRLGLPMWTATQQKRAE